MITDACQLITYPDTLGGNLPALRRVLAGPAGRPFGGVHVLPFFPSSADRGFAPLTYETVDPVFGTWEDVEAIAADFDLCVDFMFNHVSRRSEYFADFLARKDASPYADLFIRYSRFFGPEGPSDEDLAKIYTRKPRPPYVDVTFADGSTDRVWCTFDTDQIDLDLSSQAGRDFAAANLEALCRRGAKIIRLDAFAYAAKKRGTSCFFVEPEVWDLLGFARSVVEPFGVELLPEVHERYTMQLAIADHGYRVYDFALPMLVLQALYDGNGDNLKRWLVHCPSRQFTTLDTHDGIGVVDVRGLMSDEDIDRTRENLYSKGANVKRIYNTPTYNNLDIYQINCSYYSALGERDDSYLLARAIQLFAPGIPQVYYVGLLAGRNDLKLLEETKVGRNINRHAYSEEEIARELERPVVQKLLDLMQLRKDHPAFGADFELLPSGPRTLHIRRRNGDAYLELEADLADHSYEIRGNPPL